MKSGPTSAVAKVAFCTALVLSLFLIPTSFFESGHSICLFHAITGKECPGCGMTRALANLMHGNFERALHFNGLVLAVFPLLCWVYARIAAEAWGAVMAARRRRAG